MNFGIVVLEYARAIREEKMYPIDGITWTFSTCRNSDQEKQPQIITLQFADLNRNYNFFFGLPFCSVFDHLRTDLLCTPRHFYPNRGTQKQSQIQYLFQTVASLTKSHASADPCIPAIYSSNDFMKFFDTKIIKIRETIQNTFLCAQHSLSILWWGGYVF